MLRKIRVEAWEDARQPGSGRTVVLLCDVEDLEEPVVFRLRPPDVAPGGDLPEGWPDGEHMAVASQQKAEGLEIVLSASLAESAALLPGARVEIELPAAEIAGEFLWPNVAPGQRPRRRNVLMSRSPRELRGETTVLAAPMTPPMAPTVSPPATPLPQAVAAPVAPPLAAALAAPAAQPPSPPVAASVRPAQPPARTAIPAAAASPSLVPPPQPQSSVLKLQPPSEDTEVMAPPTRLPQSGGPRRPFDRDSTDQQAAPAGDEDAFYDSARGSRLDRRGLGGSQAAAGLLPALVIAGGTALIGLLYLGSNNPPLQAPPGQPVASAPASTAAPAPAPAQPAAQQAAANPQFNAASPVPYNAEAGSAIFDTFAVAPQSPKGTSSRGMSALKALETATPLLLDTSPNRDTAESAYWLKRYVVGSLGDERMMRALTKLGTLYAEPTNSAPDFIKARYIWELASAAGDPVAMCFLGILHENGLGVALSRPAALQWYERAKGAGGCTGVDDAITRVRQ